MRYNYISAGKAEAAAVVCGGPIGDGRGSNGGTIHDRVVGLRVPLQLLRGAHLPRFGH